MPTKVGTAGRPLPRHPGAQSNRAFAAEQGNAAHTRSASPQPLLAVVRGCEGITGQAETMHSAVGERALPLVTGAPGCRGFYAFRDEADPARAVSVALFTARVGVMRSHEAAVEVTREKPSGTVVLATAQYGR
ncbi:MAG: hypothetical protein ICV73_18230 [Acetobacteraceae bacterium]|nr:hypothetical protein [Acetobacteraceae bacterium]